MLLSRPLQVGGARAQVIRPWTAPSDRPLLVAISGGIGSGKTTFARILAPFAGAYADADELAREVVMPGSEGLHALVQHFGSDILNEDGALNRAHLAGLIFHDPAQRAAVEQITHPLIEQRARALLSEAAPGTLALYDVPLIRNLQDAEPFDVVIMVAAPVDERVDRLVAKGLAREDAQRRIDAQISDKVRRELASMWVENTGTQEDLETLARAVTMTWLLPTRK